MPSDTSFDTTPVEPAYTSTYIEKPYFVKPLTATERIRQEKLAKRRARAIRNGKIKGSFLINVAEL